MSQPFLRDLLDQTTGQVALCLQTIATLRPLISAEDYKEDYVVIPGYERQLEGGCPASAALAFVATCDRLTRLMKDDERFEAMERGAVNIADAVVGAQEAAAEASRAASAASKVLMAPHANLRPEFKRTPIGWVAYYGDPANADTCVMGSGQTPAEALLEFDRAMGTPSKAAK